MRGSKSRAKKAMKHPEVAQAFSMPVPKAKHEDPYEVESAAHTIERHAEVKANKKLHHAAKRHLKKKVHALKTALQD